VRVCGGGGGGRTRLADRGHVRLPVAVLMYSATLLEGCVVFAGINDYVFVFRWNLLSWAQSTELCNLYIYIYIIKLQLSFSPVAVVQQ
jgi:hypothetical protein